MTKEQEFINLIRQYKLGSCLLKSQVIVSDAEMDGAVFDVEKLTTRRVILNIADLISESVVKKDKVDNGTKFRADLFVCEFNEFKNIVEGAISLLSNEQVQMIREGKQFKEL
jgi:hypothetical protein